MIFSLLAEPELAVLLDLVLNKYNAETKRLLQQEKNPEENQFSL